MCSEIVIESLCTYTCCLCVVSVFFTKNKNVCAEPENAIIVKQFLEFLALACYVCFPLNLEFLFKGISSIGIRLDASLFWPLDR
jgi:hypothetical protein